MTQKVGSNIVNILNTVTSLSEAANHKHAAFFDWDGTVHLNDARWIIKDIDELETKIISIIQKLKGRYDATDIRLTDEEKRLRSVSQERGARLKDAFQQAGFNVYDDVDLSMFQDARYYERQIRTGRFIYKMLKKAAIHAENGDDIYVLTARSRRQNVKDIFFKELISEIAKIRKELIKQGIINENLFKIGRKVTAYINTGLDNVLRLYKKRFDHYFDDRKLFERKGSVIAVNDKAFSDFWSKIGVTRSEDKKAVILSTYANYNKVISDFNNNKQSHTMARVFRFIIDDIWVDEDMSDEEELKYSDIVKFYYKNISRDRIYDSVSFYDDESANVESARTVSNRIKMLTGSTFINVYHVNGGNIQNANDIVEDLQQSITDSRIYSIGVDGELKKSILNLIEKKENAIIKLMGENKIDKSDVVSSIKKLKVNTDSALDVKVPIAEIVKYAKVLELNTEGKTRGEITEMILNKMQEIERALNEERSAAKSKSKEKEEKGKERSGEDRRMKRGENKNANKSAIDKILTTFSRRKDYNDYYGAITSMARHASGEKGGKNAFLKKLKADTSAAMKAMRGDSKLSEEDKKHIRMINRAAREVCKKNGIMESKEYLYDILKEHSEYKGAVTKTIKTLVESASDEKKAKAIYNDLKYATERLIAEGVMPARVGKIFG